MKTISRRICGILLGLFVLGSIVPVVRADEMADWMAEQRRQNDEYHRQWQQWREEQDRANQQAQAERDAMDRWNREVQEQRDAQERYYREQQQAQAEQAAWYKSKEEDRQWWENLRRQQEWDEWMNLGSGDWSAAGANSTGPRTPGGWPAGLVILNPFALEKMAPGDQERVRQQATQSGQQIMQEQQIIQNPFVRSPK